ncbi:hypothetical protein [Lysobacter auxotrophicus]|uniref:Uncharacterized protein n=1 Tax=Lysobacter auxotrophicus TaxID=2992573 RepID=A0ABM8DA21_9GAMM|nr:hypothetical protein [Lysobacter auxotrophicus]BDU15389.1 hypothetical protein LA521A_05900 [Lysobacter auxotrophicus]
MTMNLEREPNRVGDWDLLAERGRKWLWLMITQVLPLTAALVPALYFVGRVHQEAYWHAMRVPAGVMGASFEDYVYAGFVALALGLIRLVAWLPFGPLGSWLIVVAGLILVAAALALAQKAIRAWLYWLAEKVASQVRKLRSRQLGWNVKLAQSLMWFIQWLNSAFLGFLLVVLLISGAIVFAAKSGERQAQIDLSAILDARTSGDASLVVAHLRGSTTAVGGLALGCSGEWCALVAGRHVTVVHAQDIEFFGSCDGGSKPDVIAACGPK